MPRGRTECRDCGKLRGSGLPVAIFFFAIVLVAGLVLLVWGLPFLGALLIVGSVGGLGWTAGLEGLQRLARRLSVGR